MEIFILNYDNGDPYEMNDHYTIGVFDDYIKACEFCFKKGFKTTGTKGLFKKEGSRWVSGKISYESIAIEKIKLNVELDWNGEEVK